jgi:pimeloyl-ACP methyl ester carboxylesterase
VQGAVIRSALRLVCALGAGLFAIGTIVPVAASPAPPSGRTAVLFVGGLGSTYTTSGQAFRTLQNALVASQGYADSDFALFSYDQQHPTQYDPLLTCAPVDASEAGLRSRVADLQAAGAEHVVLVGHSLGGVLAYDVAAHATDGFISGVVTVDSPLGGLSGWRANLVRMAERSTGASCPALDELQQRDASPTWQPWLTSSASALVDRSVVVVVVTNAADALVPLSSQGLPGAGVDHPLNLVTNGLNHASVLTVPAAAAQIAAWMPRQVGATG